jgi:hypothetical protein
MNIFVYIYSGATKLLIYRYFQFPVQRCVADINLLILDFLTTTTASGIINVMMIRFFFYLIHLVCHLFDPKLTLLVINYAFYIFALFIVALLYLDGIAYASFYIFVIITFFKF